MTTFDAFAAFRGGFPADTLDARRVAGLLDAPGCVRRQIIDAAAIPINKLAGLLGCPPGGQSPFAIARARQFERLVTDGDMGPLLALVREKLGVPVTDAREKDLSADEVRSQFVRADVAFRALLTRQYLTEMLQEQHTAINILRHPVLTLHVGPEPVYVEPDAVIFTSGERLRPVEIRSYPCIDGVADPDKVGATAREVAVHVLAIREVAATDGYDPHRIDTNGLLILPKNFGLTPTGEPLDVAPQLRRLARTLAGFPDHDTLIGYLPEHAVLPEPPGLHATESDRAAAIEEATEAVGALPTRFGDGCLGCALFAFCRREQDASGAVARIGTTAVNLCGDVGTVGHALDLAYGRRAPADDAETALAADLARAVAVTAWVRAG